VKHSNPSRPGKALLSLLLATGCASAIAQADMMPNAATTWVRE
jgi:hypothetical protein